MTPLRRHRRIARVAARRSAEQGLTLIELLLSLAILAILTGFLAGGLSMARQAFGADRASEIGSETSAAIQTVAALVGSALPVRFDGKHKAEILDRIVVALFRDGNQAAEEMGLQIVGVHFQHMRQDKLRGVGLTRFDQESGGVGFGNLLLRVRVGCRLSQGRARKAKEGRCQR